MYLVSPCHGVPGLTELLPHRAADAPAAAAVDLKGNSETNDRANERTNERTDRMSSDGGRSVGRSAVGKAAGGRARSRSESHRSPGSAHFPTARVRVRPRPSSSAAAPFGRDPFEMKHTHFFLVSPNGRADRRRRRKEGRKVPRPPGGKRLSADAGDGHGHGLGPPPRSRPHRRLGDDRGRG